MQNAHGRAGRFGTLVRVNPTWQQPRKCLSRVWGGWPGYSQGTSGLALFAHHYRGLTTGYFIASHSLHFVAVWLVMLLRPWVVSLLVFSPNPGRRSELCHLCMHPPPTSCKSSFSSGFFVIMTRSAPALLAACTFPEFFDFKSKLFEM
jgi:hypothetical protein